MRGYVLLVLLGCGGVADPHLGDPPGRPTDNREPSHPSISQSPSVEPAITSRSTECPHDGEVCSVAGQVLCDTTDMYICEESSPMLDAWHLYPKTVSSCDPCSH